MLKQSSVQNRDKYKDYEAYRHGAVRMKSLLISDKCARTERGTAADQLAARLAIPAAHGFLKYRARFYVKY